jgi:guanylate kinase
MIKGNLIIVSAPSGAGKSSLVHHALKTLDRLCYSISYTTRPPRGSEQDGSDYFFISRDEFIAMRDRGEFLEYAEVHGSFYGTHRAATEKMLDERQDVILDIDVQGAAQIKVKMPEAVTVFVLPPSREVLEARLRARAENTDADLQRRLHNATTEVRHCREYQYIIVNDELQTACAALEAIIRAERQQLNRQMESVTTIISTFGG